MKNAYERFVRPLLFAFDPEIAHHLTLTLLRSASHVDFASKALKTFQPSQKPKTVFGITFANPIGLAAGLDKNGVALPAWAPFLAGERVIVDLAGRDPSGKSRRAEADRR